MKIPLPFELSYGIEERPDAEVVAKSIITNKKAIIEAVGLLNLLFPELEIDHVSFEVDVISQQSPLREAFFAVLLVKYQPALDRDLPKIFTDLTGHVLPEEYHSLLSILTITVIFYGASYAIEKVRKGAARLRVDKRFNDCLADLAEITDTPISRIRDVLDGNYIGKKKNNLMKTATEFFLPIKRVGHGYIEIVGRPPIDNETILEIPDSGLIETGEPDDLITPMNAVEIRVIAQDMMRAKQGWAGIIPSVSDERLKMQITPPLMPDSLYLSEVIQGDIILFSHAQDDGSYKPYMFYLIKLYD